MKKIKSTELYFFIKKRLYVALYRTVGAHDPSGTLCQLKLIRMKKHQLIIKFEPSLFLLYFQRYCVLRSRWDVAGTSSSGRRSPTSRKSHSPYLQWRRPPAAGSITATWLSVRGRWADGEPADPSIGRGNCSTGPWNSGSGRNSVEGPTRGQAGDHRR